MGDCECRNFFCYEYHRKSIAGFFKHHGSVDGVRCGIVWLFTFFKKIILQFLNVFYLSSTKKEVPLLAQINKT